MCVLGLFCSVRAVVLLHVKLISVHSIGMGGWSSDGIETVFDEGTQTVTCLSSHLTSFAVLVDVAGTTTVCIMFDSCM